MKKTILPAIALATAGFLLSPFFLSAQQPPQVTVQDDAKVGLIVTGTGNTINTTQIFGKSPEYAELKKRLAGLASAISKKAERCGKYTDPVAKDDCRAELLALNTERDSVQKIETRFREDVIRLAETFSKIELNSERLRLAKKFFDEGKISEADNVLKEKDMAATGDAALAAKARNDSVLLQTANEFALKAQFKALKMDYDSAQILFAQSRKYFETVDNLFEFGELLYYQNQSRRALGYYEKALKLARSESEEAALAMNLGVFYYTNQKMAEAEKMYLRALDIRERLAKSNPAQFEPNLALAANNLGEYYRVNNKMAEAEKMYLRSLDIYERLAKFNPAQFEPDLAMTCLNLGNFYSNVQKMGEAEKMYLRSLEIRERLAKSNPAQFEPDLAATANNLGEYYRVNNKMGEAEKMYLRSLDIYERLVKSNPAQFEPDLARTAMNLGVFYKAVQKMGESEKMYLRSLDIRERLAKSNPAQFEPDLAATATNLGNFYKAVQKMGESEKMYLRSLDIYERLVKSNPAQFEPYLAFILNNFGYFKQATGKWEESKKMYSRGLALRQKAVASGQTHFWSELNRVYTNMADLRDSFESRGNWATVVAIQHERAACMEMLSTVHTAAAKNAPQDYGSLSRYCLFARQYPESQAAAERALSLAPSQNWVRTNLGHAYLLRGEWDKAKAVYEEYLKNEPDPAAGKKSLLKDWDDLEKAGVTHKDMEKARAWVRE